MIKVIGKEEYAVSNWNGGSTREIFLYPEDGSYKERQFGLRISSATIDIEESDFTSLPGVHRYLTMLKGEVSLAMDGKISNHKPMEIIEFEGDVPVHCVGAGTDFNLMIKGDSEAKMVILKTGSNNKPVNQRHLFIYANSILDVIMDDGELFFLDEGDTLYITEDERSFVIDGDIEKVAAVEVNRFA